MLSDQASILESAGLDPRDLDTRAFEQLLEPVLEPAYRLACGMLHDPGAAEDAVQEAAFKAWRKLGQLRRASGVKPWFLAIVANQCLTMRRSRWWSVLKGEALQEPAAFQTDSVEAGMEVRRALRAIDEDKRLVLVLHWYLDLPIEQVAAIAGCSIHAAESRLYRGMNELRLRLELTRGK